MSYMNMLTVDKQGFVSNLFVSVWVVACHDRSVVLKRCDEAASGTRAQRANIVPRACVGDLHPGTHVHRHGAGLSTVGVSRVQGRGEGGAGSNCSGMHSACSAVCMSLCMHT